MFFEYNQFFKQKERNYEFYNKGYGLRKHPRVFLTLPIELTLCAENQQTLLLECEAKDISASGLYLRIIMPKEGLPSFDDLPVKEDMTLQNPIPAKAHLVLQKPIVAEYDLEGKIVWTSNVVENPEDGLQYIFCGIQFNEELQFSIQLEQLAANANKTLEKLVAFYQEDFSVCQS